MKTKIVFFPVLVALALSLNPIKAQDNIDSVNNLLSGTWNFISCSGGLSGTCPEVAGPDNQRSVIFIKTQTDSIFFNVIRNDTLILSGTTLLSYGPVMSQDQWTIDKDVVHGLEVLEPHDYYVIQFMDMYTVEFVEPCIDCYLYRYEKEIGPTGIGDVKNTSELLAFPNPNNGTLFIKNDHPWTRLEIIDYNSKIVFGSNSTPDTDTKFYDISSLKAGIYFIRLISDEKVNMEKLIKL